MKLKKIRMIGFKSFADETVIETGAGITAIVGPNGCGKSNILDAVRWVLGEKSARGLRGQSMDDVIFLGSEFRKPAGMAEVEMIFDNRERSLDLDRDEVHVGRRIYLNSGSEYLLQGKRTTRREVERVFMDTGIGKSAYSIMEQGRMSEILRASPESRRALFDEAAGVSRFKSERKETLSRLADTDQNLLRLGDILKGKESELRNLENQAEKTRRYLQLKEDLDAHDKNLRFMKLRELEEKRVKTEESLSRLLERKDEIFKRISECEEAAEKMEGQVNEKLESMQAMDRAYHQTLAEIESLNNDQERMTRETEELAQRLTELEERRKAEDSRLRGIRKKMQESMQLELDLDTEITSLTQARAKLEKDINDARAKIEVSLKREEANEKELETLETENQDLLKELQNVAQEVLEELEAHRQELAGREDRRRSLSDSVLSSLEGGKKLLAEARAALSGKDAARGAKLLEELDLDGPLGAFREYENLEQGVRSFLFGKTGLLAGKRELDLKMEKSRNRREQLRRETTALIEERRGLSRETEKNNNRVVELELRIRDSQVRRESSLEVRGDIETQSRETQDRINYYNKEVVQVAEQRGKRDADMEKSALLLAELKEKHALQESDISRIKNETEEARRRVNDMREKSRNNRDEFEKLLPAISEQERKAESVNVAREVLEEDLYNDFQLSAHELQEECSGRSLEKAREEQAHKKLKESIKSLGQFNPLAIEELGRTQEAYDEITSQLKDVEDARDNIMKILGEIDLKSRELFLDTFERIRNNFSEVFQALFGGGKASLTLLDEADPLNSGVDIMVQPPGKKNTSLSLLSGGEQNMTAIALMFATYLVRPSPFCFLDEIDAPLDDNNVNRFLRMLSGFSTRSQFLVITHNKLTMGKAGGLFGVTQEEPGVSKLVSVQLRERENALTPG